MKKSKPPEKHTTKKEANKKAFDHQLDQFERRLEELRILYEQYFVDIFPLPPDKERKEVQRLQRELLRAPFKSSARKFRMRQLITRYNTLVTYWTRVLKAREEGRYVKDVFKAEIREKAQKETDLMNSQHGAAEKGFRQLFGSYENAMKKAGMKSDNLDYNAFRKSLMKQAKIMREKHGVKKLNYKIVVKDGKAVVKAVAGQKKKAAAAKAAAQKKKTATKKVKKKPKK